MSSKQTVLLHWAFTVKKYIKTGQILTVCLNYMNSKDCERVNILLIEK